MTKFFISYIHEDKSKANEIYNIILRMGFSAVFDENMQPGINWAETILSNINSSDIIILLITPKYLSSKWAEYEIGAAISFYGQDYNKKIVPVIFGETELPSYLQDKHFIKVSENPNDDDFSIIENSLKKIRNEIFHRNLEIPEQPYNDILKSMKSSQIARFKIVGHSNLPQWAIFHYMSSLMLNHMKLFMLQQICEIKQGGISDKQIRICSKSADLFSEEILPYKKRIDDYIYFGTKEESPVRFWYLFKRLHRPIIQIEVDNTWNNLYLPTADESVRINKYSENSPPLIDLQGAAGALVDLVYAKKREDRNLIQWENNQVGIAAGNLEKISRASQVIDSPQTPDGVRHYASQQLKLLLDRQAELNKEFGVKVEEVDIKA